MNAADLFVFNFLNGFAHRSVILDDLVSLLADQPVFKGALLTSVLWLAWFQPDPDQKRRRELVISTLAATVMTLVLAKAIRHLFLPFRLRPVFDAGSGFRLPYDITTEKLWNWSSFPSDTAAMAFVLAGGLFLIRARWGWLAIFYSLLVVCIPRIYLGYHYPSDIVAGALLGLLCAFIMGRDNIRSPLSRRILVLSEYHPGVFYCAFFLLTYEVAAVFENTRQIIVGVWHLWQDFL
jgi:undecaprenyl-diphosphatase